MRCLPVLVALGAVACSGSSVPATAAPTPSLTSTPSAAVAASPSTAAAPSASPATAQAATTSAAACPTSYAQPDPLRPRLKAAVTVSGGLVTGTETVVFTPDKYVNQVVFRLWAAAPRPARAGSSIAITGTKVNGVARTSKRPSATVLSIPVNAAAGTKMTLEVGFRLRLPTGVNDRFGHRGTTDWFGSGLPLLAWERGRGWALEPATSAFAEAATSEAMELTALAVTRDAGLSVVATGRLVGDNGRTAVFAARSVRDVAVAIGRFRKATASAAGKKVEVGIAPEVSDSASATAAEMARALGRHASRFGPFPYERLAVAILPDIRGGIEFPGVILQGSGQIRDATASHEVGHQWFYGLIGDDQARDPWLDEAFATYAEALDRGTGPTYLRMTIPAGGQGRAGHPMTYWESRQSIYFRSVYIQGAQALLRGRAASGSAAFDHAIGCHVRRNAQRITKPADLEASLQGLPAAIRELRRVGALP
jgi:hypothetical protein